MRIAYDISHYKIIKDFSKISPIPAILITKATEGHPGSIYNHTDSTFFKYFQSMMDINVVRGAYHFFRKSLNPYRQAEHFIDILSKMDVLRTDILVLDVEEGGEKASRLWTWIETVKNAFQNNPLWIYSRKNILDPIYLTPAERSYFKKIPTWTAGYPKVADYYLSDRVPSAYIPDQSKFGETVMWQYTSNGKVGGIVGGVDTNWINPMLYESLEYPIAVYTDVEHSTSSHNPLKVFSKPGGVLIETLSPDTRINSSRLCTLYENTYLQVSNGWVKLDSSTDIEPPIAEEYIEVYINGALKVSGFGKFEVK